MYLEQMNTSTFYTTSSQGYRSATNLYEAEIQQHVGCALKLHDEQYLNVVSFDDNVFDIFKQLYSVMYRARIENSTFRYVTLYNTKTASEPVYYIKKSQYILHAFNYTLIATCFNSADDNIDVREWYSPQTQRYCINPVGQFGILEDQDEELPTTLYLNSLQTINILKLYVICDHALEHLCINNGDSELKNIDYSHKQFGKTNRYLSGILTTAPSRSNNAIVCQPIIKAFEEIYTPATTIESDTDSDQD